MAAAVTPQQPIPRYEAAAHLVDATRLLLGHFEGYMASVPKMRQVRDAVGAIKKQLWEGIVTLFREVGHEQMRQVQQPQPAEMSDGNTSGEGGGDDNVAPTVMPVRAPPSSMVQKTLADACLVVEALGPKSKEQFVADFIVDHLREYEQLYNPSPAAAMKLSMTGGGSGKSFKKSVSDDGANNNGSNNNNKIQPSSLDMVENRFTWYRNKLRSLQHEFAHVFPPQWNVHYRMTFSFLEMTARHLKFILKKHYNRNIICIPPFNKSGGGTTGEKATAVASTVASKFGSLSVSTHGMSTMSKSTHGKSSHGASKGEDSDRALAEGEKAVTALLKALQKIILFEKEATAWLARDFGTKFLDPTQPQSKQEGGGGGRAFEAVGGDTDNDLEFDKRGRAVSAKSAAGIKIKYERRKRMGLGVLDNVNSALAASDNGAATPGHHGGDHSGPVPPFAGVASTTFDDHMSPYVALEERSMDEMLHAAGADATVDTRGARPVFVSSTSLFIYMKNSITRCTALTREKTFFLLQRAFQKKLRSYANEVLERKLPSPVAGGSAGQTAAMAKMALANIQGGGGVTNTLSADGKVYRIPPGEEVTICHVIDTCEYCADTVEALEDLIRDKIGDKYKEKIDMGEEQGVFQDITAKSIRVLVSGLEQRLDSPLKDISRTNWSSFDMVGEESPYVRAIQLAVHPFVVSVRELIPSSYFRSFCDKFAVSFAAAYYRTLRTTGRISEMGSQQLLLDVYSIKTLLLKLPVLEAEKKKRSGMGEGRHADANLSGVSTIAPAMYTKMVNKECRRLEVFLKLVGSPRDMLVDMFRAQWDCSINTADMAADFLQIATVKGIPRAEHAAMLETLGVEAGEGAVGSGVSGTGDSSTMTANIQALQERGSDVAAKVNADLSQMRQRVDDFRRAFR